MGTKKEREKSPTGAGDMIYQLIALVTLAEDLGPGFRIHMGVTTSHNSSPRVFSAFF